MNGHLCGLTLLLGSILLIPSPGLAETAPGVNELNNEPPAENLRERLTEREDETRVEEPFTVMVFGYPLSATLQYELSVDGARPITEEDPPDGDTRALLEQEAEGELFYTLGPQLSFLAQARIVMEEDLLADTRQGVSDFFVERGEMWFYSEQILGSPFSLDVGRLDFEDDRRWWWDEDLDAARVTVAADSMELAVAVAQELAPTRSDRDFIEPEHEGVSRVIVEASWDWSADHSVQFFALLHDDNSRTPEINDVVDREHEDDTDAALTWLGARTTGARASQSAGIFGYWLDAAWVYGNERTSEFMSLSERQSIVEEHDQHDVQGWGFDVGATWILPLAYDPRFTLGYARGSGDPNPNDGRDRDFRQTDLHANEVAFGGVQSFDGYDNLLDPELSNLAILTAGAGLSLFESSSLDLVYHYYRQVEPTDSLRDARLETNLTGDNRDIGHGLDLILAVEEWGRVEFELTASAFRAGDAFGTERGEWSYGGFGSVRLAF
jgi:hypothetical protein